MAKYLSGFKNKDMERLEMKIVLDGIEVDILTEAMNEHIERLKTFKLSYLQTNEAPPDFLQDEIDDNKNVLKILKGDN